MSKPLKSSAKKAPTKKRRTPAQSAADDESSGLFDAADPAIGDIEMEEERLADSEETLPELEREIGMADWIDPQTGEPAEGQSPPHLEEE